MYVTNVRARGFTIVELLIVIVVIAILAAVTIVGYVGITSRATDASLKAELKSAAQQIETQKVQSGANPATLQEAGVTVRSDIVPDYRRALNAYCLSYSQGTRIFNINSKIGTIETGGCALLGNVATAAGNGAGGSADGPGESATMFAPFGVATAPNGNIYFTDSAARIRKITPDGVVSTITPSESLNTTAIHVGKDGTIYIGEAGNHRVSKVAEDGTVTVIAGSPGISGMVNGDGTAARFNNVYGVTSDSVGNLYIADAANHRIRKIDTNTEVTTYAGTGTAGLLNGSASTARFNRPYGITIDPQGNLYVGDTNNSVIRKIATDGTVSTYASIKVGGLDYAADGNIYAAAFAAHTIVKVDSTGAVTTIAGSGVAGFANGTGTTASFNAPNDVAASSSGVLYIADLNNYRIRKIE